MERLPGGVLGQIALALAGREVARLLCSSRGIRARLVESEAVWRRLCERDWGDTLAGEWVAHRNDDDGGERSEWRRRYLAAEARAVRWQRRAPAITTQRRPGVQGLAVHGHLLLESIAPGTIRVSRLPTLEPVTQWSLGDASWPERAEERSFGELWLRSQGHLGELVTFSSDAHGRGRDLFLWNARGALEAATHATPGTAASGPVPRLEARLTSPANLVVFGSIVLVSDVFVGDAAVFALVHPEMGIPPKWSVLEWQRPSGALVRVFELAAGRFAASRFCAQWDGQRLFVLNGEGACATLVRGHAHSGTLSLRKSYGAAEPASLDCEARLGKPPPAGAATQCPSLRAVLALCPSPSTSGPGPSELGGWTRPRARPFSLGNLCAARFDLLATHLPAPIAAALATCGPLGPLWALTTRGPLLANSARFLVCLDRDVLLLSDFGPA